MTTPTNNQAFAAIDIGSNTFRLLIAKPNISTSTTPWEPIAYTHRIVRLGEGLHQTHMLCQAAMQRALTAFSEFSAILKQHHISPKHTLAVATAAMREAKNGALFCQQVATETHIHIQIIQGTEEAHLSLLGACAVLPEDESHDMLLFDIGGASTEFVRASQHTTIDTISCKLGVVRLVEAHLHSNPPSASDYQAMKQTTHTHLDAVEKYWQMHQNHFPKYLVGTAGTVTTLAAIDLNMSEYDADIVNNHHITYPRFCQLRDKLLSMSLEQRQAMPAIEKGRADLMIAGLAIMESIIERWNYDVFSTVDAGLLEGAWLSIAKAN